MAKFNYKDGTSSVILRVRVSDTSSTIGGGKTGVAHDSSGLYISAIADNEPTTTSYASSGSTIESITTLGTYAAPTSGKCRFKEVDSTYHPGIYEIQLANTRFNTGARSLIVSVLASGGHCPPSEIQFEPAPANTTYWNSIQTSGMPMVGYTQPSGFLSTTFPSIVASSGDLYDIHDDIGSVSAVTAQMVDVEGSFEDRMRQILGLGSANLDAQLASISGQLPSGLINGSIRSYVYEIENDAVNVAAVSTALVSWIQEDLATSSEINDLSVMVENSNDILGKIDTGLQYDGENYQFTENMLENSASGGLTASGVRNAVGLASANLDSQFSYIPTGIATHTLTESYATSGSEMTLAQALYMIQQSITEFAISGVTISVKKLDGTEAASYTLNSSTRPSSRTRA